MMRRTSPEERRNVSKFRYKNAIHEAGHFLTALSFGIPVVQAFVRPAYKGGRVTLRGSRVAPDELATIRAGAVAACALVYPETPWADPSHTDYDDDLRRPGEEVADAHIERATKMIVESGHDLHETAAMMLAGRFRRPLLRRILRWIFRRRD
jgi:hypothetical protein